MYTLYLVVNIIFVIFFIFSKKGSSFCNLLLLMVTLVGSKRLSSDKCHLSNSCLVQFKEVLLSRFLATQTSSESII